MANVTDSLDMVLDRLGELEHELDGACHLAISAMGSDNEAAYAAIAALGTTQGHLQRLRDIVTQERRLLDMLGQLVHSLKCSNCGRWFEVPPHKVKRQEYCSPACRQAAYRARRDSEPGLPGLLT